MTLYGTSTMALSWHCTCAVSVHCISNCLYTYCPRQAHGHPQVCVRRCQRAMRRMVWYQNIKLKARLVLQSSPRLRLRVHSSSIFCWWVLISSRQGNGLNRGFGLNFQCLVTKLNKYESENGDPGRWELGLHFLSKAVNVYLNFAINGFQLFSLWSISVSVACGFPSSHLVSTSALGGSKIKKCELRATEKVWP